MRSISIFSVVLVVMYGQTRILFAMGRDGMLPKVFTKVNPRDPDPGQQHHHRDGRHLRSWPAFVPLGQLAEATSIGTLAAFAIVNFGVIALWRARPELERTFKVPLMPLMPILGVVFCVYLISSLARITWVVFFIWMAIGLASTSATAAALQGCASRPGVVPPAPKAEPASRRSRRVHPRAPGLTTWTAVGVTAPARPSTVSTAWAGRTSRKAAVASGRVGPVGREAGPYRRKAKEGVHQRARAGRDRDLVAADGRRELASHGRSGVVAARPAEPHRPGQRAEHRVGDGTRPAEHVHVADAQVGQRVLGGCGQRVRCS